MDKDSNADAREGASEDIESLLSLPVNKDYINCVWTHEPFGKNRPKGMEGFPEKSVTANCSALPDQNNEEVTNSNQESSEINDSKHEVPVATAVEKAHKVMPEETPETTCSLSSSSDLECSKIKVTTSEALPILSEKSGNTDENAEKNVKKSKKKKTANKKDNVNPLKKKFFKAKDKQEVKKKVSLTTANSHVSSKSQETKLNAMKFDRTRKQEGSKPNKNVKSGKILQKPGSSNHKKVEATVEGTDKDLFVVYKNLLVQQPLPPYSPKHLDNRYFSGQFFSCKACEDKFVLQSSLLAHLSRKTVRFSFKCPVCKVPMNFDNRCGLLLHLKSHKMNVHSISQEDLSILPLTVEDDKSNTSFKHISINNLRCHECSKEVASLESHLQSQAELPTSPDDESFTSIKSSLHCKECSYVLPTACAFAAHERYHKSAPPYVCPDCGDIFLTFSSLLSHMDQNCFHSNKRTVFQCYYCNVFVLSMELFVEHFTSMHLRPVYRCHICGVSVGAFEELNAHRAALHKLPNVEPLSGMATLSARVECDKCPGVVLSSDSLQEHASSHISDPQVLTTVYMCRDCKCMFSCKNSLFTHKATCQGKTNNAFEIEGNLYKLCGDVFSCFQPASSSQVISSERVCQTMQGCSPAGGTLSVSGKFPAGNKIQNSSNQKEIKTSGDRLKFSQIADSKHSGTNDQLVSAIDSGKSFRKCRLCKEVVSVGNDKAAFKKHFASKHFSIFMKAVYDKGSAQQVVSSRSEETSIEKRNLAEFLKSLHIDYHSLNGVPEENSKIIIGKKKIKASKLINKSPGKLLSPKLLQSKNYFSCYKCSYSSENLETFKTHIISHKSNPSDLQCPQCGLCFIVRPPLEKHLIVEHGIKNVENYLLNHGFEDDLSEEDEKEILHVEETEPEELQENQCKVCKKVFESTMLLEKHFRVHGGAFLLANMKAKKSNSS